jgi:hypothetical protein
MRHVVDDRHEDRLICCEVFRGVSFRYAGLGSDLIKGRGVITLPRTEFQGGVDQPLTAIVTRQRPSR